MNNFEKLQSMSVEELAEWLDDLHYDNTPWLQWFDSKYCSKCEPIEVTSQEYENKFDHSVFGNIVECAYCEWERNCRFFPDMNDTPHCIDMLKKWLEAEVE